MEQDLSQSITRMTISVTHKIPRQNQQVLKVLKGYLVSGAAPDRSFLHLESALGKKMLTSNTYAMTLQCSLTWAVEQAECAGGERYRLWEGVARERPRPLHVATGKMLRIWQSAVNPWSKSDRTQNGCGQWK